MQGKDSKGYYTGKSLSEALIFASTNPQYDDRLFIELQVQYMKLPSWGEYVDAEIVSDIQVQVNLFFKTWTSS